MLSDDASARVSATDAVPWRLLWLAVVLVVLYLSLHPFSGWRLRHASPLDFIEHPVARWVLTDVVANVVAYGILGFVSVRAWAGGVRRVGPLALAVTLLCTLVSVSVETAQSFLPARVPSLVDVAANGSGALFGALLGWSCVRSARRDGAAGGAQAAPMPQRVAAPAHELAGWAVLALWLVAQIPTHRLALATGELPVAWVDVLAGQVHAWLLADGSTVSLQTWRAVADTLVVTSVVALLGAVLCNLLPRPSRRWPVLLALLAGGLVLRFAAFWPLALHQQPQAWLTGPVQTGIVAGALVAAALPWVPVRRRAVVAAGLAAVLYVALNTTPVDAYYLTSLSQTRGLVTRLLTPSLRQLIVLAGILWPVLAVAAVIVPGPAREDGGAGGSGPRSGHRSGRDPGAGSGRDTGTGSAGHTGPRPADGTGAGRDPDNGAALHRLHPFFS